MEQQLRAIHQTLHQGLGLGQRGATPQLDGVDLLKELLSDGPKVLGLGLR